MKWISAVSVAWVAACSTAPPMDYPSAPGAMRPGGEQKMEARELEQAEADCASQGKRAEAKRIEGETVYECVDR
jgi:hypothetical protein